MFFITIHFPIRKDVYPHHPFSYLSKVMHIHVYLFQVLGKEIRQAENQLPHVSLVILCSSNMYYVFCTNLVILVTELVISLEKRLPRVSNQKNFSLYSLRVSHHVETTSLISHECITQLSEKLTWCFEHLQMIQTEHPPLFSFFVGICVILGLLINNFHSE